MSTHACRSSSLSPTSSTSSKHLEEKKKFACTFPSCIKSFSRSEHLHRHALNHKDGNNTCLRCSAHFRRRDLLDRHMIRHKEKDDEAGGEGLGVLATRKRLWRDANGNIVNARRPSYTQEGAKRRQIDLVDGKTSRLLLGSKQATPTNQYSLSPRLSPVFSEAGKGSGCSPIPINTRIARYTEKLGPLSHSLVIDPALGTPLPSPPLSESSMFSVRPTPPPSELSELDGIYEEAWPAVNERYPEVHTAIQDRERLEYMNNSSWSNQSFQSVVGSAPIPQYHMMKQEPNVYAWQPYGQVMSRCREEKFDVTETKRPEWSPIYAGSEASYHRAYGVGNC